MHAHYPYQQMQTVTDQRGRPVSASLAWIVTLFSVGYMLPWAIAATRGKATAWGVFWINLLLGWTIIGWVLALVMSLMPHRTVGHYPLPVTPDPIQQAAPQATQQAAPAPIVDAAYWEPGQPRTW